MANQATESGPGVFKSKEELEEYLSNLGVEYRYSCYAERNPEGCYLLGDFMAAIQQDFVKAGQSYFFSCDAFDYGKGCNQWASYNYYGRGTKKDIKKAVELFRRSCKLDYGDGCFNLGQLLSGNDPEANKVIHCDEVEALKAFEKGCALGTPDSCFEASTMHMVGSDTRPENQVKAFEYARTACNEYAHFAACNNLYHMYTKGIGTSKNEVEAKKIKGKINDYLDMINKGKSVVFGRTSDN